MTSLFTSHLTNPDEDKLLKDWQDSVKKNQAAFKSIIEQYGRTITYKKNETSSISEKEFKKIRQILERSLQDIEKNFEKTMQFIMTDMSPPSLAWKQFFQKFPIDENNFNYEVSETTTKEPKKELLESTISLTLLKDAPKQVRQQVIRVLKMVAEKDAKGLLKLTDN